MLAFQKQPMPVRPRKACFVLHLKYWRYPKTDTRITLCVTSGNKSVANALRKVEIGRDVARSYPSAAVSQNILE